MNGEERLERVLGFTSFGKRRPSSCRKPSRALPQLMPGTELEETCLEVARDRLDKGRAGVVELVWRGALTRDEELEAALHQEVLDTNEEEKEKEEEKEDEDTPYAVTLDALQQEKATFEHCEPSRFRAARAATNAFERLGKSRFLNRSAMKLVTLDHVFDLTRPRGEALTFVDLCGGPGGFSEYLVWKRKNKVRGYGITLKDGDHTCAWQLPPWSRDVYTISYGQDGTGNLYSLANIEHFSHLVRETESLGVDLVVADGGFADARAHWHQERVLTKLVVAEVLTMFKVLGVHGDFVCKTFELTTRASLDLCWLLSRCFEHFAVVKPITSRPASSERYLVARGLRASSVIPIIVQRLEDRLVQSNDDLMWQLPILPNPTPMRNDVDFHTYMTAANEAIATSQVQACKRINEYVAKSKKRKTWQADPQEYYAYWQL